MEWKPKIGQVYVRRIVHPSLYGKAFSRAAILIDLEMAFRDMRLGLLEDSENKFDELASQDRVIVEITISADKPKKEKK